MLGMQNPNKVILDLIVGALASVVATAIIVGVYAISGESLRPGEKALLVVAAVFLLAGGLFVWSRYLRGKYEGRIRGQLLKTQEEALGVVDTFPHFQDCEEEILDQISKSKMAKIFIQLGRTVFSGTTFWDKIGNTLRSKGSVIQILHASPDSPYLTERNAVLRGSKYEEWQAELDHAARMIETVPRTADSEPELFARQHKDPFFCRFFLFDEIGYVQPYLYSKDNSKLSPVIKLSKYLRQEGMATRIVNQNSLYGAFEAYFDAKWEEGMPTVPSLEEIVSEQKRVVAAAIIRQNQYFIFAVPRRYLEASSRDLPFHCIGGKLEKGESCIEAVQRETREETGAALSLGSSEQTHFYTTNAELHPLHLKDKPVPYALYKRTRATDPNFAHQDILWLVGYEAKFMSKKFIRPRREAVALLYITGETLKKAALGSLTYEEIENSKDGSKVMVKDGVEMDKTRRALPRGLALIAAMNYDHRWTKNLR